MLVGMPYTLRPRSPALKPFVFGAFSWPVLLEACGYLWPLVHNGARWFCAFDADPRLTGTSPDGTTPYPKMLESGFHVTKDEAVIMARMARNFVIIQRLLPEENRATGFRGKETFRRDDVFQTLMDAMGGTTPGPWPAKVRDDFTTRIEEFAEWAPRSSGFTTEIGRAHV